MGSQNLSSISVVKTTQAPVLVSMLGDSITVNSNTGTYFESAIISSKGRLRKVVNAAIGGNTTAQMLARFDTDIAPYPCDELLIQCGTNDVTDGSDADFTQYYTDLCALVDKAIAFGAVVRLMAIPPRDDLPACASRFRDIQGYVARKKGVYFHDVWESSVDITTGGFKSGYALDGIHPASASANLAISSLMNFLGLNNTGNCECLPTSNNAFGGLFTNPIFVIDSNVDGLAEDCEFFQGVATLENHTIGKKQKIATSTFDFCSFRFCSIWGCVAGKKYRVVFGIKSSLGKTSLQIRLNFMLNGTNTTNEDIAYGRSSCDGIVSYEFTMPVGSNGFWIGINQLALTNGVAQNSYIEVYQAQAYDLTAIGIA